MLSTKVMLVLCLSTTCTCTFCISLKNSNRIYLEPYPRSIFLAYNVQADGSTDTGNVEDELYTVQYFNPKLHVDDGSGSYMQQVFHCETAKTRGHMLII